MNQGSSVGLSIQGFFGGWKHSLGLRICCPAWPICSQHLLALTPGGRFPIDRSIACERFSCRGLATGKEIDINTYTSAQLEKSWAAGPQEHQTKRCYRGL